MERRQNEQGLAVAASDDGLKEELRKLQKQPRVGKMVWLSHGRDSWVYCISTY